MKTALRNTNVIKAPRITEKGTITVSTSNAYAFDVTIDSTKPQIAAEIKRVYGVDPVKVAVVGMKARAVSKRGKKGTSAGYKKAYVYLKKGDSISII